jgi:hypothetical protein
MLSFRMVVAIVIVPVVFCLAGCGGEPVAATPAPVFRCVDSLGVQHPEFERYYIETDTLGNEIVNLKICDPPFTYDRLFSLLGVAPYPKVR